MIKILIVEDEVDIRETYNDFLESRGYTVRGVGSAKEALHFLSRQTPHVVILDMQLPGDSGILVLSFIRRLRRLARTIVIVASGHPELARQATNVWDADLFLTKPISLADLQRFIETNTATERLNP